MNRYLLIFTAAFLFNCSKMEQNDTVRLRNNEALQAYNWKFREHSFDYYANAERIKTTIKAQGGGCIELVEFEYLKTLVDETDKYMMNRWVSLVGSGRGDNSVKKTEVKSDIFRTLDDLKSFASMDVMHNRFKKMSILSINEIIQKLN